MQEGPFSVTLEKIEAVESSGCVPPVWATQNGPVVAGTLAGAGKTAAKYLKLARSVGPNHTLIKGISRLEKRGLANVSRHVARS